MKKIIATMTLVFTFGCGVTGGSNNDSTGTNSGTVAGLKTFASCSELGSYLSSKAGGSGAAPAPSPTSASAPETAGGAAAADPAPSTQASTPEEADLVKQEGNRLYILNSSSGLLIYDLSIPGHPVRIGRFAMKGFFPVEMQVSGNQVMVIASIYENKIQTKVSLFDATNPMSISDVKDWTFDGAYQESRKIGASVYLVLQNWMGGDGTPLTTQLAAKSPCDSVYVPEDLDNNGGYFSSWDIVGVNMDDPGAAPSTVSLIGSYGSTVYATTAHLYLTNYFFESNKTGIYLLGLDPSKAAIAPLADATVPGSIVNQFSMDEANGIFRIASSTAVENFWMMGGLPALAADPMPPAPPPTASDFKNYITTFDLFGNKLVQLGQIDSIAPGETITAARFLGDHAFVTTSTAYVDPLVSVDLSDPAHPAIRGSVTLPGRPGYLHVWNSLLISVGQGDGFGAGVTLNLFNIADLDHPALIQQATIPNAAYSEAQFDHRAFGFFEDRGVLAIPVWGGVASQIAVYQISPQGFTSLGAVDHKSLVTGITSVDYSPNMLRAVESGDVLITISEAGIKADGFGDLTHDLFGELFPDFQPPQYDCACTAGEVCPPCPPPTM